QQDVSAVKRVGVDNVPARKKEVAETILQFVARGGFLFAMCGATETLELAIAGHDVDLASAYIDGTPMDDDADRKMDWKRSFAFRDARRAHSPFVNSMSDIH